MAARDVHGVRTGERAGPMDHSAQGHGEGGFTRRRRPAGAGAAVEKAFESPINNLPLYANGAVAPTRLKSTAKNSAARRSTA